MARTGPHAGAACPCPRGSEAVERLAHLFLGERRQPVSVDQPGRRIEEDKVRRLPLTALTDDELAEREELLAELMSLREGKARASAEPPAANVWRFPEGENVTIVCARLPAKFRDRLSYADPESPDFVSLYTYADPDALIELFGHIRALNPDNRVNFHTVDELGPDHFTGHLVLLGGVDFNYATREVLERVKLPVKQIARDQESDRGGFRVDREGRSELFAPKLDENGHLVEDVAHFYCGASPYNRKRTVTVCNGMYGRGTLGAVRALTDSRFRDRNQAYLDDRFAGEATFSIVSRVPVMKGGQVLTPDWTLAENRLHEWPEKSAR